jgi:hypothetical protein
MEPRNRFQGMNSASLCSLAGRYDNPIPPRFQPPETLYKIPAQFAVQRTLFRTLFTILFNFNIFFSSFFAAQHLPPGPEAGKHPAGRGGRRQDRRLRPLQRLRREDAAEHLLRVAAVRLAGDSARLPLPGTRSGLLVRMSFRSCAEKETWVFKP